MASNSPAVAITGISGNLGRSLAKQLHGKERVVGIDRRPFPGRPKDLDVHHVDIRKRKAEDLFRKGRIHALIHMGISHDPRMSAEELHHFNVLGTAKALEYCARHGVRKLVVLSSANVYGPHPDNTNFLTEDAPLMAAARFGEIRDLVEVDILAQSFIWKHPEVETVIVRPVHIVGPTIRNAATRYLRLKHPWVLMGFDPMVQLIHMEDVCRAMVLALTPGVRGVYNVVGPGEVPLSAALSELGRSPLPVPHILARSFLRRLFQLRLSDFPPGELDYIQFLCTIDGSRFAKEHGWKPEYGLRETIRSLAAE
ncbi:SDR family oxidoreductase [Vulgatibacter incomptus]|uniref:UDP-glucose 4-epimerase n=1 Tax=Vulgatibacter incomptus TaxID=1391653 RepID=A0A0K1P833_9BACT|nr:SDR family oxidoreductase [Vulgatibacter incomptus]AKU89680.1 UDP-glucose 4-epimerase [Vulgatibacter incomptus]